MKDDLILNKQTQYYHAREPEYDEIDYRQGRYDRGEAHRCQWFDEIVRVQSARREEEPGGHVLELAAGTGLWTHHLAPLAARRTTIDASPEALVINRQGVRSDNVEYVAADLFNWHLPEAQYSFVLGLYIRGSIPNVDNSPGSHQQRSSYL